MSLSRIGKLVLVLPCICYGLSAQPIALPNHSVPRIEPKTANAPTAHITGPTLGFLFDPSRGELFRIPGIAGAARLGDPVDVGARLADAVMGPQQDYGIVTRSGDHEALLIRFIFGTIGVSPLNETAGVDRIAISPAGFSALLYHDAQNKLTVIGSLPLAPAIIRTIDLSVLDGELTALAISDDADHILVAHAEGDSGSVMAVRPGAGFLPIYTGGRISAMHFLGGGHAAAFSDASLNRVYLVGDVATQPTLELLAAGQDGIAAPAAIETSRDSRLLFIANTGSGVITTLDLSSRRTTQFACNCRPTRLDRLAGGSVFQLTDPAKQPVKIFDSGSRGPRVLVIPGTSALLKESSSPPRARTRSREAPR